MTDTIPDHVGREAVRLLNAECDNSAAYGWPSNYTTAPVRAVAKLLMNPPAPMTDPDEEAAKRVLDIVEPGHWPTSTIRLVAEQIRKEREAWEAGR